jgi:hypothetical protein
MKIQLPRQKVLLSIAATLSGALILTACGSGGGGGSGASGSATAALDNSPTIVGTAAYGAAVANATVRITDRSGNSACSNDPITTDASGAYQCRLTAASQAPFAVLVTDPDNLVNPMISILATKPPMGSNTTANITPITTAIAAQLDPNKDAFALIKDPASLANVSTPTLATIKSNVVQQLANVLTDAGVNPATFDPVSTPFTGGNRTGVDKMLDQVRVTFDNGSPQLSNVFNPGAASVPMAGVNTAPAVSTSTLTTTFTLAELDFAKTEPERCFAVPAATRAPNPNTVTRQLTSVAPECQDFIASAGDAPNVDIDFLQSGYAPEAYFYNLFTNSDMDGAKFNLPELMRYTTRADGRDEALLNMKFRDKNGFIDNRILTAKKFPGSRSPATKSQWWLIGNQRAYDAFIRSSVRQREQMIAQSVLDGTTTFNNAARSRFETGLEIYIRRPGFASTNNPNTPDIRYVRVKGPGLPTAGLVYADVAASLPQDWMGILNATGSIPNDTTSTKQLAGANGIGVTGNIFNIQRTQGITGTAAFTIRPNPNQAAANQAANTPQWAHPAMYGDTPSNSWTFNLSQAPAWSLYTFEVFKGTSTVADSTFTARILTPIMPAAYSATQQWHSFTSAARALVSDGAAAASSADIAWTPNTLAERIGSVNVYSFSTLGQINSSSLNVPKGIFTMNAPAVGGQYPALSINSNQNGRTLQIRHVMLDGSYKDHLIQFN